MRRSISLNAIIMTALLLVLLGCQNNPASPDLSAPDTTTAQAVISDQAHHCLGYNAMLIDPQACTVEVIPLRSVEYHFNLTGMLNSTMGVSAKSVPAQSDPAHGLFAMDITLKHPDATKPLLTGFDVKGIFMGPGTLSIPPLVFAGPGETYVENADGYTRWWNPTEFTTPGIMGYVKGNLANASNASLTATVNPYKLFADVLDPETSLDAVVNEPMDSPRGRADFTAGTSNTRRYKIRFKMDPGPKVLYGYAIDCSWAVPSPNPPTNVPGDFPIEANQPEAYRVDVKPIVNTLYFDSESGVGGGVLRLAIEVNDWQGQKLGNIKSEIGALRIYAPALMSGPADAVYISSTSTTANYVADLAGLTSVTKSGDVKIICRAGSSDGSLYKQGGPAGPNDKLSAFQVITLNVPDPECIGDANNDWTEATEITYGTPVMDQVCVPGDYRDFYYLNVPSGYKPTGKLKLWCDAEPTTVGIYSDPSSLIAEKQVASGSASINLDALNLMPAKYYIRVLTSNSNQVAPYLLELVGQMMNVTPSNPVDVTPSDLYVNPFRLYIHGNYAFLLGAGIWVYDISDPAHPVQKYHHDLNLADDTCFHYPYLYYAVWVQFGVGWVNLVDFTDPVNPVVTEGAVKLDHNIANICMNSTDLYVGTSAAASSVVNIYNYAANPANPPMSGSFSVPFDPTVLALMDPEGPSTRLIVGASRDVLSYNVEDPSSVVGTGDYTFPTGGARSFQTNGDYIYVGYDSTGGGDGWLYVLQQVGNSVVKAGSVDVPGGANNLFIKYPNVYVADGWSGMSICDITDPASPTCIVTYPLISFADDVAVEGNNAYVIPSNGGLWIYDVSSPSNPSPVTHLKVLNSVYAGVVKGDYLIAMESSQGLHALKTVDISDPESAHVIGELFLDSNPTCMSLNGNNLAVALGTKWKIFDATDPTHLSEICSQADSDNISCIADRGNVLYVGIASTDKKLETWNITNPSSPVFAGSIDLFRNPYSMSFSGDYMYLADSVGVDVYSIANPFSPLYKQTYVPDGTNCKFTCVKGSYLYLALPTSLEIADISDPLLPSHVSTKYIADSLDWAKVAVDDQFAYWVSQATLVYAVGIWPPGSPSVLGPIYPGYGHGVGDLVLDNDYLYELAGRPYIYDLY